MFFGALRKRITIQQQSATQNTRGEPIPSWTTFATCWASIEPKNGRELLAAQQVQSQVITEITIRYQSGITPDMRILYGTRYFDIQAIQNVEERNRMIVMQCIERVGTD
jgi:SPP1 family predicted phage head-tail adaptor